MLTCLQFTEMAEECQQAVLTFLGEIDAPKMKAA